jgi:hypothetical protein
MIFVGIDPGKNGGIAIINDQEIILHTIPQVSKEVDVRGLFDIFEGIKLNTDPSKIVIEDVHSVFGASASANFQFGWITGFLEGMSMSLEIPYFKIQPKIWQKEIWSGGKIIEIPTDKKDKNGNVKYKTDTKATSLLAAKRLFPNVSFVPTPRSKKDHDGLVDALLLAEYGRRKFK